MSPFNVKIKNPETNVENTVVIEEYTPTEGRGKDKSKLRPKDFENWTLKTAVDLWGWEKVWNVVGYSKFSQLWTNFTIQATTREEVVNGKPVESPETDEGIIQKDYSEMFSVLSRRGDSIQALSRRLNEILNTEMPKLTDILLFSTAPIPVDQQQKYKAQLVALKNERADLEKAIVSIKAKRQQQPDEGDEEDAKKAA